MYWVLRLNPVDFAEIPNEEPRDEDWTTDGEREAPYPKLDACVEVHAEDAGYERGEHEDDAHRSHRLHRLAHVVVDDCRVGINGRL